ncbi:MAG: hypothetical protein KDB27_31075 [Planctomycetales bacterium]|nr:hypothetical protein [Planctomycetales bacterium]
MGSALQEEKAGWIVSPAFDLCFIINLWWVLVALLPEATAGTVAQQSSLAFWQIYFITTPHRWITLLLVAADPDKRQDRTGLYLMMAVIAAVVVGGAQLTVGGFSCLLAIEYVWNAWHFGAQHGGILRIYSMKSGGGRRWLELNTMRLFPPYVSLRLVAELNGWLELNPTVGSLIGIVDYVALAGPLLLVSQVLVRFTQAQTPKLLYLLNVYAMYAAMLSCLRFGFHQHLVMLTVANAAFHSVEYFAIITHYASKRRTQGSQSAFQAMARHWGRTMCLFVLAIGVLSTVMENSRYELAIQIFLATNLWAAFMHYTYDGLIWKLRKPQTAKTLGV